VVSREPQSGNRTISTTDIGPPRSWRTMPSQGASDFEVLLRHAYPTICPAGHRHGDSRWLRQCVV
jgi:hypothetical protein